MTDTRWEECKEDLYTQDKGDLYNQYVDLILDRLKIKGWAICYPKDWPDLCDNCKGHIEEGTWHSVFNGNFWGTCEIHHGPPRGMVERSYADEDGNHPLVPYWGDPKPKH